MGLVASVSDFWWYWGQWGSGPLVGTGQHQDDAHRLGWVFLWRSRT